MAKNIRGFFENLTDNFLNIIVNVCQLLWWFEVWILMGTTLKYCYKEALNKELKLMGGAIKHFLKKILGHEIFRSMISWATKYFLKNF